MARTKTTPAGRTSGRKDYSDVEKAEAMVLLAHNKYNFHKTATDLHISIPTLRRWNDEVPKIGVHELLERAIQRLLMAIPQTMNGKDWAIALGILMDKWLMVQGEPTHRTESIIRGVQTLNEAERAEVIAEAERILARVTGGGAAAGVDESPDDKPLA